MISLQRPQKFNPIFEVVSCFLEHEGQIVLLHRQDNAREGNTWGVPAGKLKTGEELIGGMAREIKEETGIIIENSKLNYFKKIYVKYPTYDFIYHILHTALDGQREVKINPREHKNYVWVTPKEALSMNLIQDLDACIKLYYKI